LAIWFLVLWLGLSCRCAALTSGSSIAVAPRRPPAGPPRLSIEPAGRVDLGELGPLEQRSQSYTFTNVSAEPIALRVLDLSPGVTVAGPALGAPIPPRSSAELVLRVDAQDWVGSQLRNVRLETDDPGQGRYYLPVRLAVRPDLTVDGVRRCFGDVAAHESPREVFSFLRETGQPLQVKVASPVPGYLDWELQAQGHRAWLAFTLRPGRVPPGMRMGLERVRVESNAPQQPSFDLYLEWRIHYAIEADPRRLVFQANDPDTLQLTLKARNGQPFRILGADLAGAGFQLGQLPSGAAGEQVLEIRRTVAVAARALLAVQCSGEDGWLEVPVAYLP